MGLRAKEPEDEVLQAVVIADSFNERFKPLTSDRPRCLMPLLNVPLIEYTLEFLASSGVEEIFILCCAHSELIKTHIRESRWHTSTQPRVRVIVSQELLSVGDALREIDSKQVLLSDFVLVSGDVVSNVNLSPIIEEHRLRRKVSDPNAIMTMVLRQASVDHRSRIRGEESVFIFDGETNECIHWESMARFPAKGFASLELERINQRSEIAVFNNLIDCQIDICSVDVPALFTENFDWQELRSDFLKGVLESELLGKTIYGHLIQNEYAARVATPRMYDSVSKDMISRWSYPIVPESNIIPGQSFVYTRPHIYKEEGVKLAISANVEENVVIGQDSVVSDSTCIRDSVIGRNCQIGERVLIEGAYIWDGAKIGSDCIIRRSIIGNNTVVRSKVTIEPGCLIAGNVIIESGEVVTEQSRLVGGKDGKAIVMEDDDDDEEDPAHSKNIALGEIGDHQPYDEEIEEVEVNSESDDSEGSDFGETEDENDWKREAEATLERAFAEGHSIDIAALELNTLKMAMDISFHDLLKITIPSILELIDTTNAPKSISTTLQRWGRLILKFSHNEADQVDCLHIIEDFCVHNENFVKHVAKVLHGMYDLDILCEEAIVRWHESLKPATGIRADIRDSAQALVHWLQEAEEEDEDDEDEDEE
ncbi:nucleotide-diphospho-sugar transferase [Phlyctochytrium arcticum]|nr:nucleotide-diphospho-sugar transferase [Phlyctochytrium arcticum]